MTSGSSAYATIKAKIDEVEREHGQLGRQLRTHESKMSDLTTQRENYFAQLASFYLPEMEAKDVKETIRELQTEVNRLFQEKQRKKQDLEQGMDTSQERKKELQEQLEATNHHLQKQDLQCDLLQKEVAQELDANHHYVSLHAQAQQAQSRLNQNKQRHETFSREAQQKLQAYEEEPLFMYLVKRDFESSYYTATGLIEKLDRWVAQKVNYNEMKTNYNFLKSMPESIKLEIDQQQEGVDTLVRQIEAIDQEVADRKGLTRIIQEGHALATQKKGINERIAEENKVFEKYAAERKELDSNKDPYLRSAQDKLKNYLKGQSITELKQRARQTPDPADDSLVDKIEDIDIAVKDLKGKAKSIQEQQQEIAKKMQGLQAVASRFSTQDYDSRRSYFTSGFDLDSYLTGFLTGRYSTHDINSHLDSHHHLKPIQTYHSSHSYTPSYHSSYSGGIGGGGHSSTGGFGGGGHSTTGGF